MEPEKKRYKDLTEEQAKKAYLKFVIGYKESIEDYMDDFVFDEEGNAYQVDEMVFGEDENILTKEELL